MLGSTQGGNQKFVFLKRTECSGNIQNFFYSDENRTVLESRKMKPSRLADVRKYPGGKPKAGSLMLGSTHRKLFASVRCLSFSSLFPLCPVRTSHGYCRKFMVKEFNWRNQKSVGTAMCKSRKLSNHKQREGRAKPEMIFPEKCQ